MSAILITGASAGIGRALTVYLVNAGHTVWGIARNEQKLKELAAGFKQGSFYYTACNVGRAQDMFNLKTQMNASGFLPDILILNAGVTSQVAVENRKTNYEGVINTWNAFKSDLQKRGGEIAVSGSLFGLVPAPFNPSYSQSKLDALNFIKEISSLKENQAVKFKYFVLGPVNTVPGNTLPWWQSLIIPSPEKTAIYITKHLGGAGLINIFPLSSKVIILLNALLPKAVMNRIMTFLKR